MKIKLILLIFILSFLVFVNVSMVIGAIFPSVFEGSNFELQQPIARFDKTKIRLYNSGESFPAEASYHTTDTTEEVCELPFSAVNLQHDPEHPHTFEQRHPFPTCPPRVSELPRLYLEAQSVRNFEIYGRPLTDEKLRLIWEEAKKTKIYKVGTYPFGEEDVIDELGFQLDPFIYLAILGAEGTGSFDTNRGGPDDDFERDLAKAGSFLRQLIKAWIDNGCQGDWLWWVARGHAGSAYRGGYAEDPNWYTNVKSMYNYRLQYQEGELE